MPYAHIPENIEKLDSTKKISISELQTAFKKGGRLLAVNIFVSQASSRYLVVMYSSATW